MLSEQLRDAWGANALVIRNLDLERWNADIAEAIDQVRCQVADNVVVRH